MRSTRLAAVPAAALLALAGAAPAAEAAQGHNGQTVTTLSGVPASLPVGGSFQMTFTVNSTSPYRIVVYDLFLALWNTAQEGFSQPKGVTVLWDDPSTGSWRSSDHVNDNGGWVLSEPNGRLEIPPHGSLSVHLRISLSSDAARGTFHLGTNGVSGYSLLTTSGASVQGALDNYNYPMTTFRYGSGGPAPSRTPAPPRTTSAGRPAAAANAPGSTAAASPTTTTAPAAAASPPVGTAPASATSTAASVPPSAATGAATATAAPLATTGSSRSTALPWTAGGLAVLAATAGGGAVLARRRRSAAAGTPADPETD
ncbi:hypothetical protein [Kitasatospora sp. NPDC059571]|uniref:hypothetical protein n=1 Tax=Kitasatospora sp. NPDC059571 TaxID=3346871 RepID=UPI00369851A2